MNCQLKVLFFLALVLSPFISFSQTDSTDVVLGLVLVAENRLQIPVAESSRSINIISKEQIASSPANTLAEILQYQAGIDIRQRGPHGVQADVSLRGGTFDQVLILINGVKMADPQTGHHNMNLPVDLENVERIEILKGPAARVYGQNAFAGAINIITKTSDEKFLSIGLRAGQHELGGVQATLSMPVKNYKQYLSYSRNFSDGYRANTDYTISNYFYQSNWNDDVQSIDIMASYTDRAFGANRFYGDTTAAFANQYEEVKTSLVAIGYKRAFGNFIIKPRISWRRNNDDYVFIRENPEVYNNIHTSNVFSFELHSELNSSLGDTGFGIELNQMDLESNNLGKRDRKVATLFLEHRFKLMNDRLDISPGLSASYYSDFGNVLFPGLDLGYRISPKLKAFANVGYTWRIPTFTDLYYEDSANVGNEDLEPESALSYEAGIKYNDSWFEAQASWFLRDGSDLIDWTRDSINQKWQPQNFASLNMQGFDLSTTFNLKQLYGKSSWIESINLSYTYIDAEVPKEDVAFSRYVLENLRHQLVLGVQHKIFGNLHHSLRFRYLDRVSMDNYTVLDSKLVWQEKKWSAFVQFDNILNEKYRESNLVEMPGTWVSVGAKYKFSF